ncbi:hypothetical protein H2200_012056 [Cladophialophora chaetospira]|uniref:N-acetyltransferase domain-containing protein n=1 Tax=Cladophialophora chaetospira TaxID=386627 RepID=A0AA38WY55_9EURO|nr:hypothetical protein H2200_012056 [Cladophialophora chaetospira]
MTLLLHTLTGDRAGDLRLVQAVARIHAAAWMTIPLMRHIYHKGESSYPIIIKKYIERHIFSLQNEPRCRVVVVIDDELVEDAIEKDGKQSPHGRVIAAIKYYLVPGGGPHPDTGTQEVIDNPEQPAHESWYENEALSNAFVGPMVAARKHAMKTLGSHLVVDNLYTDPAHQRRGAGGILMRHACQEADDLGLPAMLEASPAGMKVYEAVGFRQADWPGAEIWIDLTRWENGGDKGQEFEEERLRADPSRKDGWYAQIVMIRPAKANGDSGAVPRQAGAKGAIVV